MAGLGCTGSMEQAWQCLGTWGSQQRSPLANAEPGQQGLAPRQSKDQVAAGNGAAPTQADTMAGQAGSLHAHTPKVEKQKEGGKAEGHDSGKIQVIT